MLVWIAPLIFAAVVAGRLFVRSRMPDKGWFVDSSRADTYMSVLVYFLDHPYANWSGSIKPVEMERSLAPSRKATAYRVTSGNTPLTCG